LVESLYRLLRSKRPFSAGLCNNAETVADVFSPASTPDPGEKSMAEREKKKIQINFKKKNRVKLEL